jgi:class 3 adenylate cyclase
MRDENPSVLLIDDDPEFRDSVARLLRTVGMETRQFSSVSDFFQADPPDGPTCLVLDVRMPGRSGLRLQRELAAAKRELPIIFITAHADVPMTVQAMKGGAIEFLTKPFRDQDLLDAVEAGLARDRARRESDRSLRDSADATGAQHRKLAAILHADVVGFSRLMGKDEAGTHRALGELRCAVDPLIASHGGRIVSTAGDSVLADFSSVVDALNCAIEMQLAARAINDLIPPDRRLELRIGVNLGDVIVDGRDIFGDGVNIAARLQALARPGTVCISHTVYEQVRNKLELNYHPLGSHRVKNIAEPIRAYVVGVSAAPGRRTGKRRRLLVAAAGASGFAAVSLVAWALHAGIGRDLHACGPVALLCEVFARPSSAK